MSSPVLAVQKLTTSFPVEGEMRTVVKGVSFEVHSGETVAIVGESGSGKSVTALSLMRLIGVEDGCRISGRIDLAGRDLLALPEQAMEAVRGGDVAMIFQEPMTSLNPLMTVGNQIVEVLVAHGGIRRAKAKEEAIRLLEKVRIPEARRRVHDYPHALSGGMRQRVMIAMALAGRPKLLIADEPTTALDVTIQAQILDLIKTLQDEEGMGVLFITHDLGVVAEIADRVVVMYQGEIVEQGLTDQIFERPRHPYTRALLAAVPALGSMKNEPRPMRFPLLDPGTGIPIPVRALPDTVDYASPPALQVENLATRFAIRSGFLGRETSRVHAVENVSFSIQPGETLSLVGESGCGKSTTGRSILRLVEPASGRVTAGGTNLIGLDAAALRRERRNIQMIFQDPFANLDPRLDVGSAIAEPLVIHGIGTPNERRMRVARLLEQVGLAADMAGRYPHEFSGGQRQRICIARALALEPKVIIADEAVSALDVSIKAQIVNLLLDLQESLGLAYLFISHDMAVVERISHRIAVMYLGEIVEIGPRAAVLGNPQHPYTRQLIEAVPVPDPSARRRRGRVPANELRSPVRSCDYVPPPRIYREVSPHHLVQDWISDGAFAS